MGSSDDAGEEFGPQIQAILRELRRERDAKEAAEGLGERVRRPSYRNLRRLLKRAKDGKVS